MKTFLIFALVLATLAMPHAAQAGRCPGFDAAMNEVEYVLNTRKGEQTFAAPLRIRQISSQTAYQRLPEPIHFTQPIATVYGNTQAAMPTLISRPVE